MEKLSKVVIYILIGIAFVLGTSGLASFFLPETSDASILWHKFGRYTLVTVLFTAYSLQVTIENKNLRQKLKGRA